MADTIAPAPQGTDAVRGPALSLSTGLPGRLMGVLTSPRATYAGVAARPRWAGALAAVLIVACVSSLIFFSTEVGQRALLDQQVRMMESFGLTVSDAAYAQMEEQLSRAPYLSAAGQLISLPLVALAIAGMAFAVLTAVLGGEARFTQVFAIVAHSGVVTSVQQLFVLPLDYARESLSSPTNLAVFLPMLDDTTFVARLLGSIDLFLIWWMISLSIGLAVLYTRRTGPIATVMLMLYVLIGLVIAAVKSAVPGA